MPQMFFERYEQKYLLTRPQYDALLPALLTRTRRDAYPTYAIASVYYDTPRFDLIRASLDKPVYKEKLRLRCYGVARADTPVYLELKKKFKGRVYKRRLSLPWAALDGFPYNPGWLAGDPQIVAEIRAFLDLHAVGPRAYIRYDRTALAGVEDQDLRITFDTGLRCRTTRLQLDIGDDAAETRAAGPPGGGGGDLLPPGRVLMEIKTAAAIPLWLCRALSAVEAYPASFSKYGACYKKFLMTAAFTAYPEAPAYPARPREVCVGIGNNYKQPDSQCA